MVKTRVIRLRVLEGPNARDQIAIPFSLSGSPNECWLHTCDACVITTWRLVLKAPLVARNNNYVNKSNYRARKAVFLIW